jgi:hypothetical protein
MNNWKKDKLSGHEWAEVRLLHRWESSWTYRELWYFQ